MKRMLAGRGRRSKNCPAWNATLSAEGHDVLNLMLKHVERIPASMARTRSEMPERSNT
jgi:hypothetical protein